MEHANVPLKRDRRHHLEPLTINILKAESSVPNRILVFGLMALLPIAKVYIRRSSSSVTKWVVGISRERFDLESPNFTRHPPPLPVDSRTGYDITYYFWSEAIAKNCRKWCLRRLCVEFLWRGRFASPNQLVGFLLRFDCSIPDLKVSYHLNWTQF